MLISILVLSFYLFCSLVLAIPQGSHATTQTEKVIIALLRAPTLHHGGLIRGRQTDNTCNPGHHQCSDGIGCCPTGQNCGIFQGKGGCCPEGKTCVTNSSPCQFAGYVLCFGENFCCPEGDICSRDSMGNHQCTKAGLSSLGVSGVPSTLSAPTTGQSNTALLSQTLTSSVPIPSMATSVSNARSSMSRGTILNLFLLLLAVFVLSSES